MSKNTKMDSALQKIIEKAYSISKDVGKEVETVLMDGIKKPLTDIEVKTLLEKVIKKLRKSKSISKMPKALATIEGKVDMVIKQITSRRTSIKRPVKSTIVELHKYNGIQPVPVKPVPMFHARPVQMMSGFVDTKDINLWANNDRLEIHINQFKYENGRDPEPEEILDIMLSRMSLKGIPDNKDDQFKIEDLARSISINGVRKPPIIDINGDLLDGNRRVAACYYILHSSNFSPEQKKLASKIFVWQLTKHATDDDRRAVVVSLNFEPDNKLDWSHYVRAKKLYEDWQTILALEARDPGPERTAILKRDLSEKYALGPNTIEVNRYLRMVAWANEFKEYHETENKKDKYEVEHHTEKYFQYFDELSVGQNAGGVAHTLNQDENFKQLVYDLLYDGKFKNWTLIRLLKHHDEETDEQLREAHRQEDVKVAQEIIDSTLTDARNRQRESRVVGANPRIRTFVTWLEGLPISSFRDDISKENLDALQRALKLVEKQIAERQKVK